MAIYVKQTVQGSTSAGDSYTLYADAKTELTGATLTTINRGLVACEPGSVAVTLAGEVLQLSTAGTWTEVV